MTSFAASIIHRPGIRPGIALSFALMVALMVAVLLASTLAGGALKAQASVARGRPAAAAAQADDAASSTGYWAAWADAASH
jgi:hypothetical protein